MNPLSLEDIMAGYKREQQAMHPYEGQHELPPLPPLIDLPQPLQAVGYLTGRAADSFLFGLPTATMGELEEPEDMGWLKYPGMLAEIIGFAAGGPAKLGIHLASKIGGKALAKTGSKMASNLIKQLGWAPTGFATEFIRQGGAAIRGDAEAEEVLAKSAGAAVTWPAIGMAGTMLGVGAKRGAAMIGETQLSQKMKEFWLKINRVPPENADIIRKIVPDTFVGTNFMWRTPHGLTGIFKGKEIYGKDLKSKYPELAPYIKWGIDESESMHRTSHWLKEQLHKDVLKGLDAKQANRALGIYQGLEEGAIGVLGVTEKARKGLIRQYGLTPEELDLMPKAKALMERAHTIMRNSVAATTKDVKATRETILNRADTEFKQSGLSKAYKDLMSQADDLNDYIARVEPGHIPNFLPHKFVGPWKIFRQVDELDAANNVVPTMQHTGSYFKNGWDAAEELQKLALKNPTEKYKAIPGFDWVREFGPVTEAGVPQYQMMVKRLQDALGMTSKEASSILNEAGVGPKAKRAFFSHLLRRTGAEGYRTDWVNVLDLYLDGVARFAHMNRFKYKSLRHMQDKLQGPENAAKRGVVEEYVNDVMGKQTGDERWVANLIKVAQKQFGDKLPFLDMVDADWALRKGIRSGRMAATHMKLGFLNMSSAAINLSQTPINTWTLLPTKYLAKGMRRGFNPNKADLKLLDSANLRMFVPKHMEADMGVLYPRGHARKSLWSRVQESSLYFFNRAERFNRATAFFGKLEEMTAKGVTPSKAFATAKDFVHATQFPYDAAGLPGFLRHGQVGRLLGQFKSFAINEMGFAMNVARTKDPIKMAKFLGSLTAIGGALSLPTALTLNSLTKLLTGFDVLGRMQEIALKEHAEGKPQAYAAMYGIPGVFGPNLTMRVEIGNFWPTDVRSMEGPFLGTLHDMVEYFNEDHPLAAEGLRKGVIGKGQQAMKHIGRGFGIPSIRNVADAIEMIKTGEITSPYTGRKLYQASEADVTAKIFGMRTKKEEIISTQRRLTKQGYKHDTEVKQRLVDRVLDAEADGDNVMAAKRWAELLRWAKRRRSNYKELNEYMRKRRKDRVMTEQAYTEKTVPTQYRAAFKGLSGGFE